MSRKLPPKLLPKSNEFTLDGHTLKAYDVSADTSTRRSCTFPALDSAVCGDVVYGDCHHYFVEANTPERRKLWLDALDTVESLKPKMVVASHRRTSQIDGPYLVQATRQYILDVEKLGAEAIEEFEARGAGGGGGGRENWQILYDKLKKAYLHRWNDFLLEASSKAYSAGAEAEHGL